MGVGACELAVEDVGHKGPLTACSAPAALHARSQVEARAVTEGLHFKKKACATC